MQHLKRLFITENTTYDYNKMMSEVEELFNIFDRFIDDGICRYEPIYKGPRWTAYSFIISRPHQSELNYDENLIRFDSLEVLNLLYEREKNFMRDFKTRLQLLNKFGYTWKGAFFGSGSKDLVVGAPPTKYDQELDFARSYARDNTDIVLVVHPKKIK